MPGTQGDTVTEHDRRRNALQALSRLTAGDAGTATAGTWTPAWSSLVLERAVAEILSVEQASVGDLFRPLWELTGRPEAELTATVANFLHDVVVLAFTRYRKLYGAEDFRWMADGIRNGATPPQAYLALLALPEDLAEEGKTSICEALKDTQFFDEARNMLG